MQLRKSMGSVPLILYGAGEMGVIIAEELMGINIIPTSFCDKNKTGMEGKTGLPIIAPHELMARYRNANIMITSRDYQNEIMHDMADLGIKAGRIIMATDILDPIPDDVFIKVMFEKKLGYAPDLENPKTFNEKLQWLKLHDRRTEYTVMADKYATRRLIADKAGEEFLVPILGVWDGFDDIDFDALPSQFVLKCSHDSGGTMICKDKKRFDMTQASTFFEKKLGINYYYQSREWPYKNIVPRIMAEEYLGDNIIDYKLLCFNGMVKCSFTCSERQTGLKVTFFDNDWKRMPFERKYPASDADIPRPQRFEEMKLMAQKLAKAIPFLRVDFYCIDDRIYTGELTLYPGNGTEGFTPFEYDEILGSWLSLPELA